MAQLENIEAIEKRLWSAADLLRTGSNYASNEYFMPVMGLVFLRHAYSRYLNVKDEIVASLPSRNKTNKTETASDEAIREIENHFDIELSDVDPDDYLKFADLEADLIKVAKGAQAPT